MEPRHKIDIILDRFIGPHQRVYDYSNWYGFQASLRDTWKQLENIKKKHGISEKCIMCIYNLIENEYSNAFTTHTLEHWGALSRIKNGTVRLIDSTDKYSELIGMMETEMLGKQMGAPIKGTIIV